MKLTLREAVMSFADFQKKEKEAKLTGKATSETQMYSKAAETKAKTSKFDNDRPATTPGRAAMLPKSEELENIRADLKKLGIETSLQGIFLMHRGNPKQEAKIRSALRHAKVDIKVKKYEE